MPGRLMYHQLFTRAQKFFIKKRKYFFGNKNKLTTISNPLFLNY
ncbi:transporter [Salmonella enterica]|nr:transporter [Salmonella enterica]